jgi:hypothetical protein
MIILNGLMRILNEYLPRQPYVLNFPETAHHVMLLMHIAKLFLKIWIVLTTSCNSIMLWLVKFNLSKLFTSGGHIISFVKILLETDDVGADAGT